MKKSFANVQLRWHIFILSQLSRSFIDVVGYTNQICFTWIPLTLSFTSTNQKSFWTSFRTQDEVFPKSQSLENWTIHCRSSGCPFSQVQLNAIKLLQELIWYIIFAITGCRLIHKTLLSRFWRQHPHKEWYLCKIGTLAIICSSACIPGVYPTRKLHVISSRNS